MRTIRVKGTATAHMTPKSGVTRITHESFSKELSNNSLPTIAATAVVGRKTVVMAAIVFIMLECRIKMVESAEVSRLKERAIEFATRLLRLSSRSLVEWNTDCRYNNRSRSS